jgi:pyruvate formate lyase activating enzyme
MTSWYNSLKRLNWNIRLRMRSSHVQSKPFNMDSTLRMKRGAEKVKPKGTKGIIFNIQRYSIHDGPGIRTTVFLKGCPLRCFWCQNPESQETKPEILLNKSVCSLCGRCIDICPTDANCLSERGPIIDRERCLGCGKCVEVCSSQGRTLVGREMTVDEVLEEVLRDKAFYDNSGGGITLSGGDPIMQPEFSLQLLRKCKEQGLHTVIETCGFTSWLTLKELLDHTDLILYDIKCLNPIKHQTTTGKHNRLILENAKKIAKSKAMKVRVPLVPGFNDSVEDIRAILNFVKQKLKLGSEEIELLPYNKLGEGKYDRLDREGSRPSLEPQSEEHIRMLEIICEVTNPQGGTSQR